MMQVRAQNRYIAVEERALQSHLEKAKMMAQSNRPANKKGLKAYAIDENKRSPLTTSCEVKSTFQAMSCLKHVLNY